MKKQPKALLLADALEHQVYRGSYDWERVEPMMLESAVELRRLHAENAELLAALKLTISHMHRLTDARAKADYSIVRAALAKATGQ